METRLENPVKVQLEQVTSFNLNRRWLRDFKERSPSVWMRFAVLKSRSVYEYLSPDIMINLMCDCWMTSRVILNTTMLCSSLLLLLV